MSSPPSPVPPSPASSDKTITQEQQSLDEALEPLMEYWTMITENRTGKSEQDINSIRHNFINEDLNEDEEVPFYLLVDKHPPLKAANHGKKYFKNCPDLPHDVTSWLESCAVRRGCEKHDIEKRLRNVKVKWQSVKDGKSKKTEDSN